MNFHKIEKSSILHIRSASRATLMTMYYRLQVKYNCVSLNLWFNKECVKRDIVPNYIKFKFCISNTTTTKIQPKIEKLWLKEEIKKHYRLRDNIKIYLKCVQDELRFILHNVEFDCLENKIQLEISKLSKEKYDNLTKKLENLPIKRSQNKYSPDQPPQPQQAEKKFHPRFVNLSAVAFTECEENLLNKGPKFTPWTKITKADKEFVGVETELNILKHPSEIHNPHLHKHTLTQIIKHSSIPNTNTSYSQSIEIISKKIKDNNLTFTKADKGNSLVCLHSIQYKNKMQDILNTLNITELKKDPTKIFLKEIKDNMDVNSSILFATTFEIRRLIPMNPRPPEMYGLVKLHKEDHPMRPVVSYVNSPSGILSKFLNHKFKELSNFSPKHTVKNSIDLVQKLSKISNTNKFKLISFDIVNMYPNIPTNECAPLIKESLTKNNINPLITLELHKLFEICLAQNYFKYDSKFYSQNSGLPMGSPLSPLLSDIFMDHLENEIILNNDLSKKHVIFWFRFVDDIIVGFNGTNRQIEQYLSFLNNIHQNMKFTVEIESNSSLNFLDLTIKRQNNQFSFNIYRKNTFTDAVIPYDSFSPTNHKLAAFHSMVHRAFEIPLSQENFSLEINTIKQIALNNKFPIEVINRIISKHKVKQSNNLLYPYTEKSKNKYISLSYIGDLSTKIQNYFSKFNLKTAFSGRPNLGRILYNTKQKSDKLKNSGVYRIECGDCNAAYVGQTGRSFEMRLKEHISSDKKSSVYEHIHNHNHKVDIDNLKILHKCNKNKKLNLLECLEINKLHKNPQFVTLNSQVELNHSPLLNL